MHDFWIVANGLMLGPLGETAFEDAFGAGVPVEMKCHVFHVPSTVALFELRGTTALRTSAVGVTSGIGSTFLTLAPVCC